MDAPVERPAVLASLLDVELDPLFWRPSRLGHHSAWTAHVPFAHWIVAAQRPRMLVELGTHNGVSYSAFCEAVTNAKLDTRCFAIDTWQGDEHAGHYDETVYQDLQRFHDQRYGAFSELLRCTFDAALPYIPDGAIDLLHIDGLHSYEAVRHDFKSWLRKLSDRAVVLFHDTNVRERGFGVWRLFDELRGRYPGFEFLHEHGLGVLAVGDGVATDVAALCRLHDPAAVAAVRERFSQLGERWRFEAQFRLLREDINRRGVQHESRDGARMRARAAQRAEEARHAASVAYQDTERLGRELRAALLDADAGRVAVREAARLRLQEAYGNGPLAVQLRHVTAERDRLAGEQARLRGSLSWRITWPLRALLAATPLRLRQALAGGAQIASWTATRQLRPRLRLRAERRRDALILAASPLFDAAWYRAQYPDVAGAGEDAAQHYLRQGASEGRNPSARFDAADYLQRYPEITAAGVNPLLHYLRHGAIEGRTIRPIAAEELVAAAAPHATPQPRAATHIVLVSGEPDTPGTMYRVDRLARAAERCGASTLSIAITEVPAHRDALMGADIVVLWRGAWNDEVITIIEAARQAGAVLVYDIDDLMVDPDLATVAVIDGIRSQHIPEDAVRAHYGRVRDAMAHADFCLASTDELARFMRRHAKPTLVLPNGYDAETLRASRHALRVRRQTGGDGLLRLGYAVGSRTHQRDFAQAAGAVARLLREREDARLVLFQSQIDFSPLLDLEEFPELAGLEHRIEWRSLVPLARLPEELARFDINLVPLEVGNPFCEAKSELKYFEAALAGACTVASPTGPFRRAIAHGDTGLLADSAEAWYAALRTLADNPPLRGRMAQAAALAALWPFGPERRVELAASWLAQCAGGALAARAFALDIARATPPALSLPPSETVFEADALGDADVTVVVPLHNYAAHIEEALESVRVQTLAPLDLIVVDDASTDESLAVAKAWMAANAQHFNRVHLLRNAVNAGLGPTRNVGFAHAMTPYVLPLDADNRLLPACCETLLRAVQHSGAAFAYPVIREFGDGEQLFGTFAYAPARLIGLPYIDAMALVSQAAWAGVGGYGESRLGWEDYEFWCRMAEAGLGGHNVPHEPLAQYRVHRHSMLKTITETEDAKPLVIAEITARHPWLSLVDAMPRTHD